MTAQPIVIQTSDPNPRILNHGSVPPCGVLFVPPGVQWHHFPTEPDPVPSRTPDASADYDWNPQGAGHDVQALRSGLVVLTGGGCHIYTGNGQDPSDCYTEGRDTTRPPADRPCVACMAERILSGGTL